MISFTSRLDTGLPCFKVLMRSIVVTCTATSTAF